jgi:hypothetical protein
MGGVSLALGRGMPWPVGPCRGVAGLAAYSSRLRRSNMSNADCGMRGAGYERSEGYGEPHGVRRDIAHEGGEFGCLPVLRSNVMEACRLSRNWAQVAELVHALVSGTSGESGWTSFSPFFGFLGARVT